MATFKQSMSRLEEIVNKLERNEIELEEAIDLYSEGLNLIKNCNNQLVEFEDKISNILESKEN